MKTALRPAEARDGREVPPRPPGPAPKRVRAPRRAVLACAHEMPFGPRPVLVRGARAGYRFALWAPAAREVELGLLQPGGERRYYPCQQAEDWHFCVVDEARPGDLYVFRLEGHLEVPDPASRSNPEGVHGPSQVVDPEAFGWDPGWAGRPWEEAVIYELHVGAFTPAGTYAAAEARLEELATLGITALELMPVASFSGRWGWGYDGVLPFAPHAPYGTPEELKHFIQAAHRHGLMVFLDVVYNHFGPDGNYLHAYAPQFFDTGQATPWGPAIAFDDPASRPVREFFLHNALYWLEEYRLDGLRLDAVHGIFDRSTPDLLEELSTRVRSQITGRPVHLVLENAANDARRLGRPGQPGRFEAQWNDDFHHAAHVLLSGEHQGYYADFANAPLHHLVRCLGEGFAFQGEYSGFHAAPRGEASAGLPAGAFVNFLQNHDQVGNRAFGERLARLVEARRLRALVAIQLLAPGPPLIFMGEEAGAITPFAYFCDHREELARAVRAGRRRECAGFPEAGCGEPPDPCAESTFLASKLDWDARCSGAGQDWLGFYRELLALRREVVAPRIAGLVPGRCITILAGEGAFEVRWPAVDGAALVLRANLADRASPRLPAPPGIPFAAVGPDGGSGRLGPWAVEAYLLPPAGGAR